MVANLTYSASPSLVNEFVADYTTDHITLDNISPGIGRQDLLPADSSTTDTEASYRRSVFTVRVSVRRRIFGKYGILPVEELESNV